MPRRAAARAALCALVLHAAGASLSEPARGEPPRAQPGAGPSIAAAGGASVPPLPFDRDKVLRHVKQTLDWYRETQSLEQLPQLFGDVVDRDRVRDTALASLRLAFGFGRAAAAVLAAAKAGAPAAAPGGRARPPASAGTSAGAGASSSGGTASSGSASSGSRSASSGSPGAAQQQRSLDQVSARIADRIRALQSQQTDLDARLARAGPRARSSLRAQRGQIAAALALEREVQGTVDDLRRFQSSILTYQSAGSKDLLGQLSDLERSVPEAREATGSRGVLSGASPSGGNGSSGAAGSAAGSGTARGPGGAVGTAGTPPAGASATATSGGAASTAPSFHPESAGIIALIGQWISLQSADGQVDDTLKSTDALEKELDTLRGPLVAQARSLVRTDMSGLASADRAQLDASRRALEDAASRFRQLATLLVPLGEQDLVLDSARGALIQWRNSVRSRLGTAARYLLLRAVILATLIALVLVVSAIWRRAAFKYLHDSRRRSQFQTLRRVAVSLALAVVILFALVSEIGSLATYVGFLTAGIAVAMQNVILAIVAYFFLIGRYGVRVGDRITLAGVTGRVADIGLIRIYLMELAGGDLHSTGRMVVLSNAVLFQPQALFKQIPGADYLWHTISLTLAPATDVQAAQQRLKAAADAVFEHYRPAIEAQHAAVQRLVDFETAVPGPEVRVRFAEHGWHFDVRYPLQADEAARIDQRMLKALRDALAAEPGFPIAEGGAPAIRSSEA